MTENEAIKVMKWYSEEEYGEGLVSESHRMAIQALEEIQQYRAIGTVEELQKSVKEEDVLKFYYIESEDKYVVGQRRDTRYYAEVGKTGLAFYMSRYLPWGEHIVDPTSAWKEHTYPSEPKEIPFFDWLQGFIKKECGGTVEECRTAVERMKPKKPIFKFEYENGTQFYDCPVCGRYVTHSGVQSKEKYCSNCGTKLDWSE